MTGIKARLRTLLDRPQSIAPLVAFRMVFGAVMFLSILRFWLNGWIVTQFIEPQLHFKYFGFHWVPEPSAAGYYLLFSLMAWSALGIAFGAFYRISALVFFLSFTYIELIDVTYYLNHYYFVSIVAFLLIFLPAHRHRSVDAAIGLVNGSTQVPAWTINLLKFQLALVYVFAGVAKLNADWIFDAMPLAIWLPAQDWLPVIGPVMRWTETAYAFSWAAIIYDLSIPFFLLWGRTRGWAYGAVIVFHLLTWILFQIGMFPFIMMGATLIFFSADFHEKWQSRLFGKSGAMPFPVSESVHPLVRTALILYMGFQLLFPLRHVLYPGNMFWHEQGYRFGWRVMLMEKAGYAQFRVEDTMGKTIEVDNRDFLTPVQEKMMGTQPDLMLQYARFLNTLYREDGVEVKGVYADVHVTLNGRGSRPFIDRTVNLASLDDSWQHKNWILPL